jgi:peptidoglycan/xylan/chitin deacetylase (PgdA/CDA1 family)
MTPKVISQYALRIVRKLFSLVALNVIGTITHVVTQDPVVALTFDDGPDPEYTPRLLDILERHHARATFFMVGKNAESYPELVQRVAQSGHAIGNHSWDHPSFPLISGLKRRAQIRACARAIAPYGKRLFRPPYGMQNLVSRLDAALLGYQVVTWNVVTTDWCGGNAVSIAEQVERQVRPGCVIVLHDRLFDVLEEPYFDREPLLEAVQILLHRLSDRYQFVTVPELLRQGRPQREIWYKEADLELLNKLSREEGPGRRYTQNTRSNWLISLLNGQPR